MDKYDNPVKFNKNEVKNKMKNLLNAFQSKSQKNGDQNKENIPDHSILVEDGEVKLFIVNKKKRVKDYLKETKRKKNKVEQNENEEDVVKREVVSRDEVNREEVVSREEVLNTADVDKINGKENTPPKETNAIPNLIKANPNKEVDPLKEVIPFKDAILPKKPSTPKDPTPPQHLNPTIHNPTTNKPTTIFDRTSELIKKRILKNKTPEKVYDVGTNRFISESNLKNVNLKNLCRSPLKDGLYKNIIDKERKSKSRIGMNKFIPKTPVPEINSDEEESYSGLITEKEISEKLKNQNHEEIEKYFNSELSIDIELLFPNIKEVSNDSPNKWG
ncbi:hypothetical protein NBO_13g0036 [Nosema bombycis CQ1]|uniref:Uncharacterized protein n=1 Tax=Nosema bombycis (strain CQ1 / CVCC 102059) TaxID=578461 RepID=R0MA78_NOSB1|nr:hypothetical protein NBO_13g0036 [Nosema bombycis CQ1]|eukprot:EOB14859.1 hypothetical protein NBO_13g0036 [Nosema bombycis CQ1]